MDESYWKGRWERGETGWHQSEVEPRLIENFKDLAPTRVLVPLCGKSLDLIWLASQGHQVVGIELSALACRTFFEENQLSFETKNEGDYEVFRGGGVTLYRGDFFKMRRSLLGSVGAVYDRAALIALFPDLRKSYSAHLTALISPDAAAPGFRFLQIVLERKPSDEDGPPFSVSPEELQRLYGKHFEILPLSRERLNSETDEKSLEECVYALKWKG